MVGWKISSMHCLAISGVYWGGGEMAPMPPVLGPWLPSKARLWSWLAGMGTTCLPSAKASTVTSGPTMHSSMTTVEPDSPNFLSAIISVAACLASSTVEATTTPLPRARPSAFTTMGAPCSSM